MPSIRPEVREHGSGEEEEVDRIPPAVEKQGGNDEPGNARLASQAGDQEVEEKRSRKKEEEEFVGVEEHPRVAGGSKDADPTGRFVSD